MITFCTNTYSYAFMLSFFLQDHKTVCATSLTPDCNNKNAGLTQKAGTVWEIQIKNRISKASKLISLRVMQRKNISWKGEIIEIFYIGLQNFMTFPPVPNAFC